MGVMLKTARLFRNRAQLFEILREIAAAVRNQHITGNNAAFARKIKLNLRLVCRSGSTWTTLQ